MSSLIDTTTIVSERKRPTKEKGTPPRKERVRLSLHNGVQTEEHSVRTFSIDKTTTVDDQEFIENWEDG